MTQAQKRELEILACKARIGAIIGTFNAKSGHPGGSLSAADLYTYLYFREMRVDPQRPDWADRDRFVLSKGHCCPSLYAILALKGYFSWDELSVLRHVGAMLQGHPDMKRTPGIDMSSGSLGQGISAACGMALAAKIDKKDYRVYTVLGDGECEEGEVWEAAMFAGHRGLDNLTVIVDVNGLQIDGTTAEIGGVEPLDTKFESFGFDTVIIDGHNFDEIEAALAQAKQSPKPFAIIMKTVKGKGVSFMENEVGWHGKATNAEEYKVAMAELEAQLRELEADNG